jgi:hypothetical protein
MSKGSCMGSTLLLSTVRVSHLLRKKFPCWASRSSCWTERSGSSGSFAATLVVNRLRIEASS